MDVVRILRELWSLKAWLVVGATVALLAALNTAYQIQVFPPGLHKKSLEIGSASTRVLVDSQDSAIVDLKQVSADFSPLAARAEVLGNLMTSAPAKNLIAEKAHLPAERIEAISPTNTSRPEAITQPGSEQRAASLVAESDVYRILFSTDPQLPILSIVTQAPSASGAERLANAAASAVRTYVSTVAVRQRIPEVRRVVVSQLGPARGGLVNPGINKKTAGMTFFAVFMGFAIALLLISGIVKGWRLEQSGNAVGPELAESELVEPRAERPVDADAVSVNGSSRQEERATAEAGRR